MDLRANRKMEQLETLFPSAEKKRDGTSSIIYYFYLFIHEALQTNPSLYLVLEVIFCVPPVPVTLHATRILEYKKINDVLDGLSLANVVRGGLDCN